MTVLSAMPAHGGPAAARAGAAGLRGSPCAARTSCALSATCSSRLPVAQRSCGSQAPIAAIGRSELSGCGLPPRWLNSPQSHQQAVGVRRLSVQSSSASNGDGLPGSAAAATTGTGKASSPGSAAAAAAAAAAGPALRRAPQQQRPSVPFFPPDASSEEDEPTPRSRQQAPSQRPDTPQSQPLGGKAPAAPAVPGAGVAVPGRGSVAVSAAGPGGGEPLRKRRISNSDLDPSRPLPLAMTAPTRPLTPEEVQEQLNCDPELQFCKDPVYQWTSKCTKCAGSGYARAYSSRSRKSGRGKGYSDCKCITCCGIGYVYRYTTRSDIPVMGDVEWEDQ